jgi:hypothetical protein
MINSYAHNPAFILGALKGIQKIGNNEYAQQSLLFTLDELSDKPLTATKETNALRSRLHLSTFKFMEAFRTESGQAHVLQDKDLEVVAAHVSSIMYAHLITNDNPSTPQGMHPFIANKFVSETSHLIYKLLVTYKGQESNNLLLLAYDINNFLDSVFGWTSS